MPKNLQIYLLKKRFLKANADRNDNSAEMDNIDWDIIDSTAHLPENLQLLANQYPEYNWGKKTHEEEITEEGENSMKQLLEGTQISEWEEYVQTHQRVFMREVRIKSHKIKLGGKQYTYGRIQVMTPPKLIGFGAVITVTVTNDTAVRMEKISHGSTGHS